MNTNNMSKNTIIGLAGFVFMIHLLVFFFLIEVPDIFPSSQFVLPFLISFITAIGVYCFFPSPKSLAQQLRDSNLVSNDLSAEELAEIIHRGQGYMRSILEEIPGIQRMHFRKKIKEIAETGYDIFEGFKDDPSDVKRSSDFINQYVPMTLSVVQKYADYTNKTNGQVGDEMLEHFESTLNHVQELFEQQKQHNLHNDDVDLTIELNVLQTMIKNDTL